MTNILTPPQLVFADIDGSPLDAGFIFIGQPNLDPISNPISIYWDEEKTDLATQPISTRNGYISRNGSPAKIYIDADICSVLIKNANGSLIYNSPSFNQVAVISNISNKVLVEKNRAEAAEAALSNSITTEVNRSTAAETLLNTNLNNEVSRATAAEAALQTQVNAIGVGNKSYKTYALMSAASGSIPANSKVTVTNDSTSSNNGDWNWDGTTFTKSVYDPLTQAKTYTDDSVRSIEINRSQNKNKFTLDQILFNTFPTATTGTRTVVYRNGIKQMKLVSAATGGSIVAYWDFDASLFTREFSASLCIEGLTSGSDGLIGIQQLNSSNSVVSSTYALTSASAAITKQTFKMNIASVTAGAVKIRLIVNMLTASTREMYINSLFIADGNNAEFIRPDDVVNLQPINDSITQLNGAFNSVAVSTKNKFDPSLAENGKIADYKTGNSANFPDGILFGKRAVEAGKTYTLWIPTNLPFSFQTFIYTYSSTGTYLGLDRSVTGNPLTETVNLSPPTGIGFLDANKTVTFTIPSGSSIAYIQLMAAYRTHTLDEFNTLVNSMQLEEGGVKTSFEPYSRTGYKLVVKESALPSLNVDNTFTLTIDGVDAYIRTPFNSSLDLVQQVRYGSNITWANNIISPWEIRTIPNTTARDSVIAAFGAGTLIVTQGDDAAPQFYNGTYIGGNHGANIVHQVTVAGHGKTYVDVGSRWTNGANTWTIVRIVDVNTLWLVSQNIGTTYWQFVTSSLNGLTLTHSAGATNTSSFTPSADVITQLWCALNNRTKKIVINGFKEVSAAGVYDVQSVELVDNYDIMNPVAIISYLQAHTGTATEQKLNIDSIASDMRVSMSYKYAINGSYPAIMQIEAKNNLYFGFSGTVQAVPLNYSGKTLLQYVPKVGSIVGSSKTWNFANVEDITTTIDRIDFLKASWIDPLNPPDRMAQIVKNGANKEFGQVLGYVTTRGIAKPSIRTNTTDAGFVFTTRKMYPKAINGIVYPSSIMPAGTVLNIVAYRSIFDSTVLPQATVFTWFQDNNDIYIIFDIHQNASMLKLPFPSMFNGKSATVIDSNTNFTLHNEIVSDGGLLCSVINNYGQATIKLS